MMPTPLAEAQVLSNLHEYSHIVFKHLQANWLQSGELIFAAENWSLGQMYSNLWGVALLTSYRFLSALALVKGVQKVSYSDTSWLSPPAQAITREQLERLQVQEIFLRVVAMQGQLIRRDYIGEYRKQAFPIMELFVGDRRGAFSFDRGKQMYDMLQSAVRNGGSL